MTFGNKLRGIGLATAFTLSLTGVAAAQDPESGDTGSWQGGQQGGWGQQQGGWGQQQGGQQGGWGQQGGPQSGRGDTERPPMAGNMGGGSGSASQAAAWDNGDDHLAVVGHLGVGFFGTVGVPIGGPLGTVSAPTVGMRYWLSEGIGLDVALGFGFTSGTVSSNSVSVDLGAAWALAVRGGLPIALAHFKHYKFLLVPEIVIGFSGGSDPNDMNPADYDDDVFGGVLFSVGGRVGSEIHFGFIGVPQLSLQASVGLAFTYQSVSTDICGGMPSCGTATKTTTSTVNLNTNVQQEPWDLFTGSIAAIYYF
jgi:hypothetical protein